MATEIKNALRADGWKVTINDGLTVNPGAGMKFGGQVGNASRYTMRLTANFIDYEFPTFQSIYSFDLSVIDNHTGEEIANGYGKHVTRVITRKVMEALK